MILRARTQSALASDRAFLSIFIRFSQIATPYLSRPQISSSPTRSYVIDRDHQGVQHLLVSGELEFWKAPLACLLLLDLLQNLPEPLVDHRSPLLAKTGIEGTNPPLIDLPAGQGGRRARKRFTTAAPFSPSSRALPTTPSLALRDQPMTKTPSRDCPV